MFAEIGPIQSIRLNGSDSQHISPLTIRGVAAGTKPSQLLEQYVFGGMEVQRAFRRRANLDALAARQLLLVQGRATGDEQIDLDRCWLMDQIDTGASANGSSDSGFVSIKFRSQRFEQTRYICLVQSNDDIDVDSGAWLPTD